MELDGRAITDRETLHRLLAETLGLPAWYGSNLDALYDCLTDLHEDTELTITHWPAVQAALGSYAEALDQVFLDATRENERLCVILLDEDDEA